MATTTLSRPLPMAASTHSRVSRSSEPWCSAISPAQSGRASSRAWYQSSVCARVLVKTRLAPSPSSACTRAGSIARPRCPAQGKRPASAGSRVSMRTALSRGACTSRGGGPCDAACRWVSTAMACAGSASVAEMPQTQGRLGKAVSASCSCTPRLLPSSSCHSSATTSRSRRSCARPSARESITHRLSGVVTSTSGGCRSWRALTLLAVSPVRHSTRKPGSTGAASRSRACRVSCASARIGVTHSTCRPPPTCRASSAPPQTA